MILPETLLVLVAVVAMVLVALLAAVPAALELSEDWHDPA